jgi:hypothetical protein
MIAGPETHIPSWLSYTQSTSEPELKSFPITKHPKLKAFLTDYFHIRENMDPKHKLQTYLWFNPPIRIDLISTPIHYIDGPKKSNYKQDHSVFHLNGVNRLLAKIRVPDSALASPDGIQKYEYKILADDPVVKTWVTEPSIVTNAVVSSRNNLRSKLFTAKGKLDPKIGDEMLGGKRRIIYRKKKRATRSNKSKKRATRRRR